MTRKVRAPAFTLALAMLCSGSAAEAGNGFFPEGVMAIGTATRIVTADTMVVTANFADRMTFDQFATSSPGTQAQAIIAALTAKGVEVQYTIVNTNPTDQRIANEQAPFNEKETYNVQTNATFRMRNFGSVADVAKVLFSNGIRQRPGISYVASEAGKIRDELSYEATDLAIAKARAIADHAKVKVGAVTGIVPTSDLQIPPNAGNQQNQQLSPQPGQLVMSSTVAVTMELAK